MKQTKRRDVFSRILAFFFFAFAFLMMLFLFLSLTKNRSVIYAINKIRGSRSNHDHPIDYSPHLPNDVLEHDIKFRSSESDLVAPKKELGQTKLWKSFFPDEPANKPTDEDPFQPTPFPFIRFILIRIHQKDDQEKAKQNEIETSNQRNRKMIRNMYGFDKINDVLKTHTTKFPELSDMIKSQPLATDDKVKKSTMSNHIYKHLPQIASTSSEPLHAQNPSKVAAHSIKTIKLI